MNILQKIKQNDHSHRTMRYLELGLTEVSDILFLIEKV